MINFSYVSYINQHKQVHASTQIYHMCNIFFDVITMQKIIIIITDITTFDINHDAHI
jgi:hypothetical protein